MVATRTLSIARFADDGAPRTQHRRGGDRDDLRQDTELTRPANVSESLHAVEVGREEGVSCSTKLR